MELAPGEVISGRFSVDAHVGGGGMGVVYRAVDLHTNETVALKLLRGDIPDGAPRFARESQALARLSHPSVVRYVAHGVHARTHFLAMEWLEGQELSRRLRSGPLPVADTVTLGIALAEALGHAHGRGVIHRDVKPSNVLLLDASVARVKLVDFGLALVPEHSEFKTSIGTLLGTAGFLAPEQARGQPDVGPAADVFSLGCLLYKCLTGQGPFSAADAVASLAKLLLDEPAPLPSSLEVPPELTRLVGEMLSKHPSERPAGAATVAERLREVLHAAPSSEVPLPPPSLTGRERRVVSVVVAARQRLGDDERTLEPIAALDVSDAELGVIAERMGARVDRVPGAIVATLFGQGSATDQAARAARLALAMRPLFGDVPLALATGRAEVGERAVGEAIDRAVERAVSLAGAPRDGVWVDAVTAGLLGTEFSVEPGDDGGWLVAGGGARAPGMRTLLGKRTPCVGRDRELGNLDALFAECEQDSVARALLVLAPAGAGKSRLRHEWLSRVARRVPAPQTWQARAEPMTTDSPFAVLRRCVRRAMGLMDEDGSLSSELSELRQKIHARVLHADVAEPDRVAEFLGELCGVPMADEPSVQLYAARRDPILMGDQFRRAWEDWVAGECARGPVILVLEDIHWADRPSLQFVEHALRRAAQAPLLVVALARPEVDDRFPGLWSDRAQRMQLPPLGARAGEALARSALGEVAPDVLRRIVERADGNAFFLEEIVRAVAEGRGEDVPETVLAMVQRRVEALEPDARKVLRAASVFGAAFSEHGVAALLGGDARTASDWLETLAERELVSKRDARREWVFRHALVREGAYAMLTEADRSLGHRLAAEWLEQNGERDPVALAKHFEIGGMPGRAAVHYLAAAKQGLGGSDLGAVVDRVDRAAGCLEASGETSSVTMGEAHRLRAEALRWMGRLAEAEQSAQSATDLLARGSPAWFAACAELATAAAGVGHTEVLRAACERVRVSAAGAASDAVEAVAPRIASLGRIAGQLYATGMRGLADELVAAAEEQLTDRLAEIAPEVAARVRQALAYRALYSSDIGTYYDHMRASSQLYARAGDRRNACVQAANMGYVAVVAGALDEAEEALVPTLRVAESLGMARIIAIFKQNIGLLRLWQGRIEESQQVQREAIAAFEAQGDVRLTVHSKLYMASALAAAGDRAGAVEIASAALAASEPLPPAQASALATLADLELSLGRHAEALEHATRAYELLERLHGLEDSESLVRITYVEALAACGRAEEARSLLIDAFESLHARAAKLKRADWRRSFLQLVPDNRRILERAVEWGLATRGDVDEA
ncbi:MAG TPA: protein kinase [Polyangiaceae bacterium]|nr:protein kinase [Polyangiaceae bacterium]